MYFYPAELALSHRHHTHSSVLPRDGGAWWASVRGVAQSRTRLKRLSSSSIGITWPPLAGKWLGKLNVHTSRLHRRGRQGRRWLGTCFRLACLQGLPQASLSDCAHIPQRGEPSFYIPQFCKRMSVQEQKRCRSLPLLDYSSLNKTPAHPQPTGPLINISMTKENSHLRHRRRWANLKLSAFTFLHNRFQQKTSYYSP